MVAVSIRRLLGLQKKGGEVEGAILDYYALKNGT